MPDSNSGTIKGLGLAGFTRLLQNIKANIPKKTSELQNDSGFLTHAPVTSVNGQTGDISIQLVAPVTGIKGDAESEYREGNVNLSPANIGAAPDVHTHAASDITSGTLNTARIPSLDASKITSGTLGTDRIPSLAASKITSGTFGADRIPSLSASKINSGTFAADRIPGLDASKITSGIMDWSRIPKTYQRTPTVVDFWFGDQAGAAINNGTVLSGNLLSSGSTYINYHFQYIQILFRSSAGSGDNFLWVIPYESGDSSGFERYGSGYNIGISVYDGGNNYARHSIGYFYWKPSTTEWKWNVGNGFKGSSGNTSALVPLIIRGAAIA